MNHGGTARCVALHTHPVAHTRQIGGRFNRETELARKFRISLCILIPDDEGATIDGGDARNALSRLKERGGMLRKPVVKS
jgi:hypothetical protein